MTDYTLSKWKKQECGLHLKNIILNKNSIAFGCSSVIFQGQDLNTYEISGNLRLADEYYSAAWQLVFRQNKDRGKATQIALDKSSGSL